MPTDFICETFFMKSCNSQNLSAVAKVFSDAAYTLPYRQKEPHQQDVIRVKNVDPTEQADAHFMLFYTQNYRFYD